MQLSNKMKLGGLRGWGKGRERKCVFETQMLNWIKRTTCIRCQVQCQADFENTGAIPSTNLEDRSF